MKNDKELVSKIKKEIEKIRIELYDIDCDNNCSFWEYLYNDYDREIIDISSEQHMLIVKMYQPKYSMIILNKRKYWLDYNTYLEYCNRNLEKVYKFIEKEKKFQDSLRQY